MSKNTTVPYTGINLLSIARACPHSPRWGKTLIGALIPPKFSKVDAALFHYLKVSNAIVRISIYTDHILANCQQKTNL